MKKKTIISRRNKRTLIVSVCVHTPYIYVWRGYTSRLVWIREGAGKITSKNFQFFFYLFHRIFFPFHSVFVISNNIDVSPEIKYLIILSIQTKTASLFIFLGMTCPFYIFLIFQRVLSVHYIIYVWLVSIPFVIRVPRDSIWCSWSFLVFFFIDTSSFSLWPLFLRFGTFSPFSLLGILYILVLLSF